MRHGRLLTICLSMTKKKKRKRPDVEVGDYKPGKDEEEQSDELPPAVAKARAQLKTPRGSAAEDPQRPFGNDALCSGLRLVPRDEVVRSHSWNTEGQVYAHPGLTPKAASRPPASSSSSVVELSQVTAPLPKAKGVITKEQLDNEREIREARAATSRKEEQPEHEDEEHSQGSFESLGSPSNEVVSGEAEEPAEVYQAPEEIPNAAADNQDAVPPEVCWLHFDWFFALSCYFIVPVSCF